MKKLTIYLLLAFIPISVSAEELQYSPVKVNPGTITSISTGAGLTGGPITTTGTISCINATSSAVGCVEVDNSTIIVSGGVISANTGTSGPTIPLLNAANTWSATQTFNPGSGIAQYNQAGAIEEAVYPNGNSGTSISINLDNGNAQSLIITNAVTISFTSPTHPGAFHLIMIQDGTGHAITLSGVKNLAGTPPTFNITANSLNVLSILYDGTNFYVSGGGFS